MTTSFQACAIRFMEVSFSQMWNNSRGLGVGLQGCLKFNLRQVTLR